MGNDSSDDEWSDIEEKVEDCSQPRILCLFCKETFQTAEECLGHMVEIHEFNLLAFCKSNKLDFYDFIKLINYMRANCLDGRAAGTISLEDFSSDEFLKPVLPDDTLLQIDFEGLMEAEEGCVENGKLIVDDDEMLGLRKKLKEAEERAVLAEGSLSRAVSDLSACKKEMRDLLLANASEHAENDNATLKASDKSIAYFESYAHHGIHEEMLRDEVRTQAYRDFIVKNSDIFKDKVVLDVGCGTGILSMFAASAGAKLVIAVDQSDIAYQAMDIIRENNLHEVITVIKEDAEQISLPKGIAKVDLIISEWMGYFLLFESMLDSILRCRDKLLCEGGLVFPDSCSISLAALADEKIWDAKVGFWDEVYGYKMSSMKKYALEEPIIDIVDMENICSNAVEILSLDINNVKVQDLEFEKEFQIEVTRSGPLVGLVGYFDIGFYKSALNPISFSTGYHSEPTHWKQTLFLFENKVGVLAGEILKGTIDCRKNLDFKRALSIRIKINKGDGCVIADKAYTLL